MLVGVIATVTLAAGTALTVTTVVAVFVSLVAVMVDVPAATPVTKPVALIVALAGVDDVHVTVRPVSVLPLASFNVDVIWTVCSAITLGVSGAIATVETAAFATVTTVVPLFPSLVAVMFAVPAATPVTTPADVTLATAGLSDTHVTTRFVTVAPLASFTVAAMVAVTPVLTLSVAGTLTLATPACETVTVDAPIWPSLVAVIDDVPGATAVTTPASDTVATAAFADAHVMVRPLKAKPVASLSVGVSETV